MQNSIKMMEKIIGNVERIIVGKRDIIELILMSLICEGHVLIEDVPGVGKTTLVHSFARSINASFNRIQFTPDVLPSDVTGFSMFNQKLCDFEYRSGAIMSQIILADEINRTTPKTQSSLLEVMEEHQVTVDGVTYSVPKPFMVLATQNPIEYIGTYPLPEAQIDRFFMKITIGYPLHSEEMEIISRFKLSNPIDKLKPVADNNDIIALQDKVKTIHVDESIINYIVQIVEQTRNNHDVMLGSSPRGSLSLFKASQAHAFLRGRNYVIPDDVKKMSYPVLSHKIILKQEATLKKLSTIDIITSILDNINIPVV